MTINEIRCRSILNKSGIPGVDYALNPYTGCAHKCRYCYAVFMKRFSNHNEPWGDFVDVKVNAPDVLREQLKRLRHKNNISFGTVCDPYQPLEAKYELTRKCLEILSYYRHSVSILTKSPLVLRDADILVKIKEIDVGFSFASSDPEIARVFETGSATPGERFDAINALTRLGIPAWVFVAPVLPCLSDSREAITRTIKKSQDAGARCISFDTLNPYPKVMSNVMRLVSEKYPDAVRVYKGYPRNKRRYERELKERILDIGANFNIKIDFAF
jgi:DNA repair photolyase